MHPSILNPKLSDIVLLAELADALKFRLTGAEPKKEIHIVNDQTELAVVAPTVLLYPRLLAETCSMLAPWIHFKACPALNAQLFSMSPKSLAMACFACNRWHAEHGAKPPQWAWRGFNG
jgi:hypothetical protein